MQAHAHRARRLSRRVFLERLTQAGIVVSTLPTTLTAAETTATATTTTTTPPAERSVIRFPGPWQFQLPRGAIILVSDQQLEDLTDPDKEVDLSLSATPDRTTLRRRCEQHQAQGARTMILAFDEFWSQYRAGQGGKPRQLTPDTEQALQHIARIGQTLARYGLGLELSLLSPLEIGAGYSRATGESGRWVQFREGWRDPATGHYSVGLWEQRRWTNNKGTITLRRENVRAFAFKERRLGQTAFYAVAPGEIRELTTPPVIEEAQVDANAKQRRLTIRGSGNTEAGPLDRVLVVVRYAVPEMDYFSPKALPFLEDLVRRYHGAGVPLNGLYADEMHIQQDWGYASHHEEGQFALRYLTPHLARTFAERYGAEFADLEKFLVYFCYGQHGFLPDLQARLPAQHVLGGSPEDVQRTWLLRRRYYQLLHETVVDLFANAKHSAEKLYGHPLEARAHATWAQSPTIDFWRTGSQPHAPRQYEYTPDFLWSNTVQQAASACSDYFKWNDFLTGGGNDHAEGGWSDRNYYGLALACSTGSTNAIPNAYAAAWGMPAAVHRRHRALENAFGCSPDPAFAAVLDHAHRDSPVLMLYPSSLVACEERFGSWMVQYGYANFLTPEKLLQLGRVESDGTLDVLGRRYRAVVVLFEPLPPQGLLPLLQQLAARGGRIVWSGPPPRFDLAGQPILEPWKQLFGIQNLLVSHEGVTAPGQIVSFEAQLQSVPPQTVLTDFLVDQLWPVDPAPQATVVARLGRKVIGIHHAPHPGASVTFLGFRPRDDQAASLGYETRTWFEILRHLQAYPGPDDPSVVSRTSPVFAASFPNGALTLAAHYRNHVESWPGGFHREATKDDEVLRNNPLPSDRLNLENLPLAGTRITYHGELLVAFRENPAHQLAAFAGYGCDRITLQGREHRFADRPLGFVAWAPVPPSRLVPDGALLELWVHGEANLRLPWTVESTSARLFRPGPRPGTIQGDGIPLAIRDGFLEVPAGAGDTRAQGHHYVVA